jgi:hypothetical protein
VLPLPNPNLNPDPNLNPSPNPNLDVRGVVGAGVVGATDRVEQAVRVVEPARLQVLVVGGERLHPQEVIKDKTV